MDNSGVDSRNERELKVVKRHPSIDKTVLMRAAGILFLIFSLVSFLPVVRGFQVRVVGRALMRPDFNGELWSHRILKISLVICAASVVTLIYTVLNDSLRRNIVRQISVLLHKLPRSIWLLLFTVIFVSLYFGRNINLFPLVLLFFMRKYHFLSYLNGHFGKIAVRRAVSILICSFAILVFCMLFYRISLTMDLFGTDSPRVFDDISAQEGNSYYRVYAHPLYVLFWQTAFRFLSPLIISNSFFVRLLILIIASINVGLFSLFTSRLCDSRVVNILTSAVFLCSSPVLYQGAQVVESFVFSQFSVLLCVIYFEYAFRNKSFSYPPVLMLAILVVGCNFVYVFVLAALLVALLIRTHVTYKETIRRVIISGVVSAAFFSVLLYMQFFLLGRSSGMPRSIGDILNSALSGDVGYIQHVSLSSFAKDYFSTALYWSYPGWLGIPNALWQAFWCILLLIPILAFKRIEKKWLFTSLIVADTLLFFFHYKYDPSEISLFAPVTGVMLLLLVPFGFEIIKNRWFWSGTLAVLLASELIVNVPGVYNMFKVDQAICGSADICGSNPLETEQFVNEVREVDTTLQDFRNENFIYKRMTTPLGRELVKGSEAKDLSLALIPPLTIESESPSFSFGLGNRAKYQMLTTWQAHGGESVIKSIDSDQVIAKMKASTVVVDAANYRVSGVDETGTKLSITENDRGVYINGKILKGTDTEIDIPDFSNYKYPELMRTLYHEIMFQIIDGKPYTRLYDYAVDGEKQYPKLFYRDAAMIAMFLSSIGQIDQISGWIETLEKPYDQVRGVKEPDNLGQVLYLQSLLPRSHRNETLIREVIEEARRIKDDKGNLTGTTDGDRSSAYQNGWLIFGLKKLGLEEIASEFNAHSDIDDNGYSALLWFTLSGESKLTQRKPISESGMSFSSTYTNVAGQPYPYLDVAKSHFNMLRGQEFQAPIVSQLEYPVSWGDNTRSHSWHDAELLMYLQEFKK